MVYFYLFFFILFCLVLFYIFFKATFLRRVYIYVMDMPDCCSKTILSVSVC